MSSIFFLSYATPAPGDQAHVDAVNRFYVDLSSKVAGHVKLPAHADVTSVGFRDSDKLMAGAPDWKVALAHKLVEFPVGVVLRSAQYLAIDRPWCRWECLAYTRRNEWADQVVQSKPRMLLVLNWSKVNESDVPPEFPAAQMVQASIAGADTTTRDAVQAVFQRGLRETIELAAVEVSVSAQYKRFVGALAEYLVAQWDAWRTEVNARQLDPPPPEAFDPALNWSARATNAADPGLPRQTPKRKVIVVYIAAQPHQVAAVAATRQWRYLDDGESDWQAFAQAPGGHDAVGAMMASGLKDIEIERLPFEYFRDHVEELLRKFGQRYPVLFIVDPWSASQIDEYRKALEACAQLQPDRLAYTCPVVVWNSTDHEQALARQDFEQKVECLFSLYQWEVIENRDDFAKILTTAVQKLQRMIRNARADLSPHGGTSPPRISPSARP